MAHAVEVNDESDKGAKQAEKLVPTEERLCFASIGT